MHKFLAALRLKPLESSTAAERRMPPSIVIEISNDTGSNLLSIFRSDLDKLHFNEATYHALIGIVPVLTAAGCTSRVSLAVQLRVLNTDGLCLTDWFDEVGVIIDEATQGLERLSGRNIRTELYLASDRKWNQFTALEGL